MKKEIKNQKQGLIMKIFGLFVAFTLMYFSLLPAAHAVVPAADADSSNVAESAAMGTVATHPNQGMIRFAYTTDPILCCFNEQVKLHGKIRISFKQNGRKATASLENFDGVGLTTKREYVAGKVTFQKLNLSQLPPIVRLFLPTGLQIARLTIPVAGKHPTDLNSATGDPLPGKDVHFQLVYGIGWRSRNGRVTKFIPDFTIGSPIGLLTHQVPVPDGKGAITCN
jgi:hypothetical protein